MHDNMTIQRCITLCRQKNSVYAVLRAGNACHCQEEKFQNENRIEDSECNIPCAGDDSDICGGQQERMSVYDGQ